MEITAVEKHVQIEYVALDQLRFAPFNPRNRTGKAALAKLRASIERVGRIIVPLVVTGDNIIADGHRRATVAQELGIQFVPIIRADMALCDLWSNLNSGTMQVNQKTWMQAAREGLELDSIPDKERRQITELKRIVGERIFKSLADAGRSPYILTMAKMVARYCDDESDKFIRDVIVWFEECQQQFVVRRAIAEKCPQEVIMSAVKENRPLRPYWGVA